ncbi:MAG: DUF3857 domain-containing protein [Polyangiaceae bacterium]
MKVYRPNGKIDQAIETGQAGADDPSISMYTSARTFYVHLPRLEPGDVVELRYRVEDVTPRNDFGDSFAETALLAITRAHLVERVRAAVAEDSNDYASRACRRVVHSLRKR